MAVVQSPARPLEETAHLVGAKNPSPAANRGWSLSRRVWSLAAATAVLIAAGASWLVVTASQLRAAENTQLGRLDASQQDAAQLLGLYLDEETGIRGYLLGHRPVLLAPFQQASAILPSRESALVRDLSGQPAALSTMREAAAAFQLWRDDYALPVVHAVDAGQAAREAKPRAVLSGKVRFDAVRTDMNKLSAIIASAQDKSEERIRSLEGRLEELLAASLAVGLATLSLLVFATKRNLVNPLALLGTTARRVANGELRLAVTASGPREVLDLAADLDAMRERLLVEIDTARSAAEALHQQSPTVVALAAALQPHVDHHPEVDAAAAIDPAEGVLAGDWCDIIRLDDRLGIVVGDVSGHGPESAVLALRLRSILTASLRLGTSPGVALSTAARSIMEASHEHFATVFVAIVDPRKQELVYANAGHPDALVKLPSRTGRWAVLAPTGPLLSPVVATSSWATQRRLFTSGTGLLVVTDGVLEARNPGGDEYTFERLRERASALLPSTAESVVAALKADVASFSAGRHRDDRTIVYCSLER